MKKLIVMLIALALVCVGCMKNDAVTPENEGENRAETQDTAGAEKGYPEEETTPYSANLELNSTTNQVENEGGSDAEEPPILPIISEETIGQETSEEPVNNQADDGAAVEAIIEENPSPDPSPTPQEAPGESNTPIPTEEPAPAEESSVEPPVKTPEAETEGQQDIPQPLPEPLTESSLTPMPLSDEEPETEQEEPASISEPDAELTLTATPTEEPTMVEIETPIDEPEPEEIEIETPDESTAPLPTTEEPTTEEPAPEEPTTNEPVFINPAHGGTNPFENPGDTEIDEHDSGEYFDDDGDRPGEGIHF